MDVEFYKIPVPRDLPLPLPLPESALQVLLVLFFLAHILFVNLMVGGSILVVIFEKWGRFDQEWDRLAHAISKTVTVNKSMAVVMGIGPLLCINLLYTMQWYSANSLTGHAWLLIVPLVTAAFLLTYLHKYTWDYWSVGRLKTLHQAVGFTSLILFLFIPLIFLSNINLMLFPDAWSQVRGFVSTLFVGNVFPRYIHFLLASVAITALFVVGLVRYNVIGFANIEGFTPYELKRKFYDITAFVTLLQYLAGPLLLLTLPNQGVSAKLLWVIFTGSTVGILLLWLLRREIKSSNEQIGQHFWKICGVLSIVVLSMGSGRAIYRQSALAQQKEAIAIRTQDFEKQLKEFKSTQVNIAANPAQEGEKLFLPCSGCHAVDSKLVGPALTEIAQIYKNNPDGIVAWAKAPGKKRADSPQMPAFAYIEDEDLFKIAQYILMKGKGSE